MPWTPITTPPKHHQEVLLGVRNGRKDIFGVFLYFGKTQQWYQPDLDLHMDPESLEGAVWMPIPKLPNPKGL